MKQFSFLLLGVLMFSFGSKAAELKVNDPAPGFETKTQEGKPFSLEARKGQWTVLYFYPKADTPGCTKQACAFRDGIEKIRKQGADVFGVSADTVEEQAAFYKKHHLNFTLLADANLDIINKYGTKMPIISKSKRWTFVIDPALKVRAIEKDVDPVKDAEKVAGLLQELKKGR
jgi:peroxiredoxin Q/BCP